MERRLGRGLGSLLGEAHPEEANSEVALTRISPNPHQPREVFDASALEELRDSIRNHGVLQPIALRAVGDRYEIIAGERRWRAARLAGLSAIPAVVRSGVTEEMMLELAMVENVQRQDLNPLERARGYRQMIDRLGGTQEEIARRVGLKRATVANHLRLLDLPEQVQVVITKGLIGMGHARALLGLQETALQIALTEETVRKGLSVRNVEQRVRDLQQEAKNKDDASEGASAPVTEPWVTEMQGRIGDTLGTKVTVKNRSGYRGQIVIDYFDRDELERLYTALAPREEL